MFFYFYLCAYLNKTTHLYIMLARLVLLVAVIFVFNSCKSGYSPVETGMFEYETHSYLIDKDTVNSLKVSISIPEIKEQSALKDSVMLFYRSMYTDSIYNPLTTPADTAVYSILTEYINRKANDTEVKSFEKWSYKYIGRLVFENSKIAVFEALYNSAEGADYYDFYLLVAFDKETGRRIKYTDLIKNEAEFSDMAERIFRAEYGLGREDPFAKAGYAFKDEEFFLPESFTFGEKSIIFLYNRYEIAPGGRGQVVLKIPVSKAKKYLNMNLIR